MEAIVLAPPLAVEVARGSIVLDGPATLDVGQAIESFLAEYRSTDTARAYKRDLRDFFLSSPELGGTFERTPDAVVKAFFGWPTPRIRGEVALFKTRLIKDGKAEATINRSLSSVTSLLKWANGLNLCDCDGRNLVKKEKVKAYRDTRGVDVATLKRLLAAPLDRHAHLVYKLKSRETPDFDVKTLRDLAMLHALCENGLRRAEVSKLRVKDVSLVGKRLAILGKGRGTQKEWVTINAGTQAALAGYLLASGHARDLESPLFLSCDHKRPGAGITGDGIRRVVMFYGRVIGEPKLTPHKLRHSAITALADACNGNVKKIKDFSRHAKTDTVMIYIDNAKDSQGEMTNLLGELLK